MTHRDKPGTFVPSPPENVLILLSLGESILEHLRPVRFASHSTCPSLAWLRGVEFAAPQPSDSRGFSVRFCGVPALFHTPVAQGVAVSADCEFIRNGITPKNTQLSQGTPNFLLQLLGFRVQAVKSLSLWLKFLDLHKNKTKKPTISFKSSLFFGREGRDQG